MILSYVDNFTWNMSIYVLVIHKYMAYIHMSVLWYVYIYDMYIYIYICIYIYIWYIYILPIWLYMYIYMIYNYIYICVCVMAWYGKLIRKIIVLRAQAQVQLLSCIHRHGQVLIRSSQVAEGRPGMKWTWNDWLNGLVYSMAISGT